MFRKNADPICLSKLLKDFSVDNVKKTALYRYVYDSPLDYDSIDVDDFVNIHKHLIKSAIQNLVSIYYKKLYWVIKRFYNQNVALACNSEGHTKCVSLNNWPYQAIPRLVDINSNDFFYPFTVSVNKWSGRCNYDLYAWVCFPNKAKYMNVKVFKLMLGETNETKYLVQHDQVSLNMDWIKVRVIQSKDGIMMNVGVSVKN